MGRDEAARNIGKQLGIGVKVRVVGNLINKFGPGILKQS